MLKDIILDTSEGECARGIEAERFEIPRDQFHRCNSAIADIGNERLAIGKRGLRTPEPEARRIGQVVDVGRSGGRGVEHPCPGQEVLQTHPGDALRSEEHTSELQSLMRTSHAVYCLK